MSGKDSIFDPAAAGDRDRHPSGRALGCAGGRRPVPCGGVGPGWAPLAALLRVQTGRPILLLAANLKLQEQLQQDLETWLKLLGANSPANFPRL